MTDGIALVDVAALERLPLDEQIDALGEALRSWGRMEVTAVWSFGCALRSIKAGRPRREWAGIRDRIGIARETARRFMLLADSYDSAQIGQFCTVDAALQAIAPETDIPGTCATDPARPGRRIYHFRPRPRDFGEILQLCGYSPKSRSRTVRGRSGGRGCRGRGRAPAGRGAGSTTGTVGDPHRA